MNSNCAHGSEEDALVLTRTISSGVLNIIINRASKRNAISPSVARQLVDALTPSSTDVKAILLTARGPDFCSGADLESLRERLRDETISGDADALNWTSGVLEAMETCPVPIVVAAQGRVLGAGMAILALGHVRLLANNAVLALPEAPLGIFPIGPYPILSEVVGRKAFEWGLTGRSIYAEEAMSSGLVDIVEEASRLESRAIDLVETIASMADSVRGIGLVALEMQRRDLASVRLREYCESVMVSHIADIGSSL